MKTYKIIYAKNEVIACEHFTDSKPNFHGDYYYEQDKGQVIYAMIRAESEPAAIAKAQVVVKEATEKIFGNDFIL